MAINCPPLLADLFLYSYEVDFMQRLCKKNERKLNIFFNFIFHFEERNFTTKDMISISPIIISLIKKIPANKEAIPPMIPSG